MCSVLSNDWKKLSKKRFTTKYLLLLVIFLLSMVLTGQLIAQVFTVSQFSRVTGTIIETDVERTGFYSNGSRFGRNIPIYSLVLRLANRKLYYVSLGDDPDWTIKDMLHKGDRVTIYIPPAIYQVLSLNGLQVGNNVSQLEFNHQVLYGLRQEQQKGRKRIALLVLALLGFMYFLNNWYQYDSSSAND
jgi:hypothetical protein